MNRWASSRAKKLVRSAILGGSAFLVSFGSVTSLAQDLVAPTAPPPPVSGVGAAQNSPNASALPPSSVSPAIERFLKQSGRDPQPAPRQTAPSTDWSTTPPPSLPPAASPTNRRDENLNSPDLPPALPNTPTARAADPPTNPRSAGGNGPPAHSVLPSPKPEPSDRAFPINLATALRLSDARPLVVAAAQARVWVAEAELTQAKVIWVPTLTFGADYLRHDGGGPDFNKGILTAPSTNYFYAGPSLYQYYNVTDAIFQPLVARQKLNARHWDVQSAKNNALMKTADAYFQVHRYRGTYAGAIYTVMRGRELIRRFTALSKDLIPRYEVDRARNLVADLEQRAVSARQEWRTQSADLTEILRLDPRAVVEPMEHDHTQITLIDPGRGLDDLMSIALTNRPELGSRKAEVEAAAIAIRREKNRPLLPLVLLNGFQTSGGMLIQGGIFGIGPNNKLNQFDGRSDASIQLAWQLEGLGYGNLARIKSQRGQQSRSFVELRRTQDMIAADVTRAQARVQSASARVLQADRALRTGLITYNKNFEGLGQTIRFGDVLTLAYRPQEVVYALKLLNTAFEEYFSTVAEYNLAQFDLYHAIGYPADEVALKHPPGQLTPVDITRPKFLPPVGHGPPPATR